MVERDIRIRLYEAVVSDRAWFICPRIVLTEVFALGLIDMPDLKKETCNTPGGLALDHDGRRDELARIIGGVEITQATLDYAEEMLKPMCN